MIKRTNVILTGIVLALVAGHVSLLAGGARPIPANATSKITAEQSKEHIELLASDAMMGRNTPSPELDSAASYIAGKFKEYGLEPVNGSYYHEYFLKRD